MKAIDVIPPASLGLGASVHCRVAAMVVVVVVAAMVAVVVAAAGGIGIGCQ